MAHIGGFIAGIVLIFLFGGRRVPPPGEILPGGS
jgi:membrane associated rhomboid family serine protease